MHPQMPLLYQLQQLDEELDQLHQLLAQLDSGDALRQRINRSRQRLEEVKKHYRELQIGAQDQQLKLQSIEERIRKAEADLYSGRIRNPRELETLQHEIDSMRRVYSDMELELLRLWEEMETVGQQIQGTETELQEVEQMFEHHVQRYHAQKARLESEIATRQEKRAQLVAQIAPPVYQRYEAIRPRLARKAVARVEEEACTVCRTKLTPYLIRRLKEETDLVSCESCGRLLYWAELAPADSTQATNA